MKTKSGCEDTILGQILPPRGGVSNHFSENSSDLGHYFLPSSPEKSRFTLWLDAADPSRRLQATADSTSAVAKPTHPLHTERAAGPLQRESCGERRVMLCGGGGGVIEEAPGPGDRAAEGGLRGS